jgi:signal transduction histidine kinase
MNETLIAREKFKRLEKINEFFTYFIIVTGIIVIQLPLPIDVNKSFIYLLSFFMIVFVVGWHRLVPEKYAGLRKNFIEALVDLVGIHVLIILTGGVGSYFFFLYLLPVLSATVYMHFRVSIFISVAATVLVLMNALEFVGTNELFGSLSIAGLQVYAIWLISAYGRFLSNEISLAKKKEEEIKLEEIREVDRLKDEFIFIVSHELRSPITAIRGYLELLVSDSVGKISGKIKEILVKAFVTSNELSNLVSLMLEVARLETGKIHFYFQEVLVGSVLDKVVFDLRKELEEKNLDLKVDIADNLKVKIDAERLEEIFTIVLGNSVIYTPEFGKIDVSAEKGLGYTKVKVTDNGLGMDEEKRKHLFEKFYTERVGTSEKTIKGINIGLYVVKQLLSKMGGDVSVDSKLGEGTTFTIKLPVAEAGVS